MFGPMTSIETLRQLIFAALKAIPDGIARANAQYALMCLAERLVASLQASEAMEARAAAHLDMCARAIRRAEVIVEDAQQSSNLASTHAACLEKIAREYQRVRTVIQDFERRDDEQSRPMRDAIEAMRDACADELH